MECTQRLECTQELYESRTEKTCLEQIGFIGICGTKYPVKRGPNKIGRDPQTCNIVLQLNSISRQHAVINVLNNTEFMLMDLDSANKTKLMDKTLQPYIPHPLKNGDMVQFGDVFGVFRLLEEDNDLPMTQALDIPETPIIPRHASRINNVPITTIPESPDVSDRDDSFIAPSQPKGSRPFTNSSTHFIKPSTNTIAIQSIGSNKIDNIYWNSSKKSASFGSHLDDSRHSLNDSVVSEKSTKNLNKDINFHEMETQPPPDGIHNASADSIYTASTQLPTIDASPSIHNINTQLPTSNNLPEVRKINNQHEMQFDLYTANKINSKNIFDAETQQYIAEKEQVFPIKLNLKPKNVFTADKDHSIYNAETQCIGEKENIPISSKTNDTGMNEKNNNDSRVDTSGEEILFEEIDELFEDNFESQSLLPVSPNNEHKKTTVISKYDNKNLESKTHQKEIKKINYDSSTDCEDIEIIPTQQLPKQSLDDDLTDCEDELNGTKTEIKSNKPNVNFEDMLTQIIDENVPDVKLNNDQNIEDMATQVLEENQSCNIRNSNIQDSPTITNEKDTIINKNNKSYLEDLPTQVLDDDIIPINKESEKVINLCDYKFISPFKIPFQSPIKIKRKDILKVSPLKEIIANNSSKIDNDDNENYYVATQDLMDDLCTQAQHSPEITEAKQDKMINNLKANTSKEKDFVPCSVEEIEIDDKLPGLDNLSPLKNIPYEISGNKNNCSIMSPSNMSTQQIREVIGVDCAKPKNIPSDSSDVDVTPKKKPFRFLDIDLPNSQEIKTSVTLMAKDDLTESLSESDTESEEQFTPILMRKKKRSKVDSKLNVKKNLIEKLNIDALPTRVISRKRQPTSKIQNSSSQLKNILKPKFLTEQEENINEDIINENIRRLKSKNEKSKNKKHSESNLKSKISNSNTDNRDAKIVDNNSKRKNEDSKHKDTGSANVSKINVTKSKTLSTEKIDKYLQIDTTIEKSKRSTRGRKQNEKVENKTIENTKETKTKTDKRVPKKSMDKIEKSDRKQTDKKVDKHDSSSENIKEVRRSRRHKSSKNKTENDSIIKVKITKPIKKSKPVQHEKSTVYNISSESEPDQTVSLKRSATEALRAPSPKRTRSGAGSSSSRATLAKMLKTQYILFTAFPCEEVKAKLEKLGAVIVTDVTACTVLLTLNIKRTFKLLCAVGLGKPIVGAAWVQACADNNMIVDPWLHLIKDEAAETRFKFNLERTLRSKRNFLKGYNISSTPSVMPNASEMKLIVESSGGTWKEGGSHWMCVSCSADKNLWPLLKQRGATIVSTEFILGGVLRQKMDVANSKLG
ncbi:LOW QUALITY PROTEIN: uncharacterized protein ACR2FA_007214 [Aphomia sociella]